MRVRWLTGALLFWSSAVYAQNPCTVPASTIPVLGPSDMYVTLPKDPVTGQLEHNIKFPDGTFHVTEYEAAYFDVGADPKTATPRQGPSTVTRASLTGPVAGTTDCFSAKIPISIPSTSGLLVAAIRPKRSTGTSALVGEWSPASNPFGPPPPSVLTPTSAPVFRRQ